MLKVPCFLHMFTLGSRCGELKQNVAGVREARGATFTALLGAITVTRTSLVFSSSDDRPEILTWILRIARLPTPIAAKLVTSNT